LKLRELTQFVRELGIACEDLQSRFEIKRVLAEVEDQPEQKAVNYAILRAMQKAVYSPLPEPHYALNKDHYCHFTSPIRRYPDLTVHRLLDHLASGKPAPADSQRLLILGDHCSDREQRAEMAERELVKIKLLSYLSQHIGMQLDAVVTGVEDYGLFVQGVQLPAEGLVHISSLQDDYYHFDATTRSLVGRREDRRYRLGDAVQVEVFHVDLDRRELDFRVLGPASSTARPATGGKKRGRSGPQGGSSSRGGGGKGKRRS
jgi:ribonuclease R